MIRGLHIQRKARVPLKTVACVLCGFIIYKETISSRWRGRGTSRRHCSDCQQVVLNARNRAHYRIDRLIEGGLMVSWKGQACVDCGVPAACHDVRDYSRPEDAVPVCTACNGLRGSAILGKKHARS